MRTAIQHAAHILARFTLATVLACTLMPAVALTGAATQAQAAMSAQAQVDIKEATVEVIPRQVYTGNPIEPKPKVTYRGTTLVEGTDYTLEYHTNTGEGTANVYINGMGNYTGRKITTFEIIPAQITSLELSQKSYFYDGTRKRPIVTVKCGDTVLVNGQDYIVVGEQNMDRTSVGVHTIRVKGTANYAGELTANFEILPPLEDDDSGITSPANPDSNPTDPDDKGTSMFRLYNPNSGEHFYTRDAAERDNLTAQGWSYEGEGWKAPSSGDAVYRLYNSIGGEHHYTLSQNERDVLVSQGWTDEGIGWYSDTKYTTPLYRQYNPNQFANNHNYTTDTVERDHLDSIGWRYEGISWYGL